MVSNRSSAEAAIRVTADEDASKAFKDVGKGAEGAQRSLGGLSRGFAALGIGSIGAGFALREVIKITGETAIQEARLEATLKLLGPAVREGFEALQPSFALIAANVKKTERDVEKAFALIVEHSGGVIPSINELQTAFEIAAGKGVPLAVAAEAVGAALRGNVQPLNQLIDPSGTRGYKGLDAVWGDLEGSAATVSTSFDEVKTNLRELGEELGVVIGFLLTFETRDLFGPITGGFDAVTDAARTAAEAIAGVFGFGGGSSPPTVQPPPFLGPRTLQPPDLGTGINIAPGLVGPAGVGQPIVTLSGFPGGTTTFFAPGFAAGFSGMEQPPGDISPPGFAAGFSGMEQPPGDISPPRPVFAPGFAAGFSGMETFAHGGVVTRPTLGIVGEAGPEAIIPLDRAGGLGNTFQFIVQGNLIVDDESRVQQLTRSANRQLQQQARGTGQGLV